MPKWPNLGGNEKSEKCQLQELNQPGGAKKPGDKWEIGRSQSWPLQVVIGNLAGGGRSFFIFNFFGGWGSNPDLGLRPISGFSFPSSCWSLVLDLKNVTKTGAT